MGFFKSAFVKVGSVAKQQAIYPFISALPLANNLSPFFTRVKGSVSQTWPSTGTTSVCPDMKGYIACCLATLPTLTKADLKKPIYFAFSYDEEIGCLAAPELIEHIKETYPENATYAIIGEPSSLEPVIGKKGVCYVQTEVNGSAGHSSGIHKEISAIHESTRLIMWLENKMNLLSQEKQDDRFEPPHSTLHVGQISGGVATNIVSDYTRFEWDVRVIPKDTIQPIFDDFFAFCKER